MIFILINMVTWTLNLYSHVMVAYFKFLNNNPVVGFPRYLMGHFLHCWDDLLLHAVRVWLMLPIGSSSALGGHMAYYSKF